VRKTNPCTENALRYPEITFIYIVALLSLVYGATLIIFLKELRENPKAVMARFKLNREKTTRDFKYMLLGNVTVALFMFTLFIALQTRNIALLNAAYAGQVLGSAMVVITILSWVKEYAV
jgi:drug/metabolite transporter (DMT)-like permease